LLDCIGLDGLIAMKLSQIVLFFIVIVAACASAQNWVPQKPTVVLGTNVLQKKSRMPQEMVQGGSVDHVKCILDKMQVNYEIRSLPWRRARQDVHASAIDGFFTAVAIDDASDYATFSAPLVLENWYWFWRTDTVAPASWKEHFQVGVILGSQQEAILSNEGYTEFVTANNIEQLVKLLLAKRIDVVLLDKEKFENTADKMQVSKRIYKSRFFRYMPLGVYFGGPFLAQHPDFLTAFNSRISTCSTMGFDLSDSEKETIKKIVAPWFQKIGTNKDVLAAVIQQNNTNRNKPESQLMKIDEQWQFAFKVGNFNFPKTIINQSVSQMLRQFSTKSKDLLAEIIVMDERGYNVAVADMTSDYWQGDEDKFIQVFNKSAQTVYFDQIQYDASSKRFQVQVSTPLFHPQTQVAIGAITLGIDIDKALSHVN
jgi:ABC-type amino acid transport substrate-binding protein